MEKRNASPQYGTSGTNAVSAYAGTLLWSPSHGQNGYAGTAERNYVGIDSECRRVAGYAPGMGETPWNAGCNVIGQEKDSFSFENFDASIIGIIVVANREEGHALCRKLLYE
jgi:hypothetical protein